MKRIVNAFKRVWVSVLNGFRKIGVARLGWYAALAALLVALGSASYVYRNKSAAPAPEATPIAVLAAHTPDPLSALVALPEPTPEPTPEPIRFLWPVAGEIVGGFAEDHMVYNDDLGQWQTHPALDISAAVGEAVAACADGVVADAWEDALWGNVITIRHRDGYVSAYANLSTLKLVNIGDEVAAGQTISAVGRTAACEQVMPDHLHFSLERDGKPLDPGAEMEEGEALSVETDEYFSRDRH